MVKWILAAIGVVVLSLAISAAHMHLSGAPAPYHYDPAAFERARQIELQYEPVPLVRLLATPERYDGRKVRVSGFVTLAFEDSGIHLDRSGYETGLRGNALWLDRPDWLTDGEARRLNRRYGEVAGTFDASKRGHMGAYSGALTQLRHVAPSLTESDYQQLRLRQGDEALAQHLLSGWFLTFVGWTALGIFWILTRRRA